MITVLGSPRRCCDGLTRRDTLKAGALSLLGGLFGAPSPLRADESPTGKAKRLIAAAEPITSSTRPVSSTERPASEAAKRAARQISAALRATTWVKRARRRTPAD